MGVCPMLSSKTQLTTPLDIVGTDTLNMIVVRYPQALPVLQQFGLDTCCGGALPLSTAVEHHGLNLEEVRAALQRAIEDERR